MSALAGSCHCGQVHVTLTQRPAYVNDCNCTFCTKLGALWGYLEPQQVDVAGTTTAYERADVAMPAIAGHFCPHCGATICWTMTGPFMTAHPGLPPRMGINMRLFDAALLTGMEMRFPDGLAWTKDGPQGEVRPPVIIG